MLQWYTMFWGTGSLYLSCSSRKCGKPYVLLSGKVVSLSSEKCLWKYHKLRVFHNSQPSLLWMQATRHLMTRKETFLVHFESAWENLSPIEWFLKHRRVDWGRPEIQDIRPRVFVACLCRILNGMGKHLSSIVLHNWHNWGQSSLCHRACGRQISGGWFRATFRTLGGHGCPTKLVLTQTETRLVSPGDPQLFESSGERGSVGEKEVNTHFSHQFPSKNIVYPWPLTLRRMLASMSSGPHLHAWWASSWRVLTPWPATNLHQPTLGEAVQPYREATNLHQKHEFDP